MVLYLYISSICSLLAAAIAADADQDDDENNSSNDSNNNIFKHVVADVYLWVVCCSSVTTILSVRKRSGRWHGVSDTT